MSPRSTRLRESAQTHEPNGLTTPTSSQQRVNDERDGALRFLAAPPPPPPRMTAVLAQVHEVVRAADDDLDLDLDLDPALAACLERSLAGPS